MKKKSRTTWLGSGLDHHEAYDASEADDFMQPNAIRVHLCDSPAEGETEQHRVLELQGLQWSYECAWVPGPDELQ